MDWKLVKVEDVDCTVDDSGLYTVIHRLTKSAAHKEYAGELYASVRADLMGYGNGNDDEPIMSFVGSANAVRKALVEFISARYGYAAISSEHASYIGYELMRAEKESDFVQD